MIFAWSAAGILAVVTSLSWLRLRRLRIGIRRLAESVESGQTRQVIAGASKDLERLSGSLDRALQARKRSMEAAHRREHLFTMIADGLNDGILVLGLDLKLTFFNSGAVRLFPRGRVKAGAPLIEAVRDHRIVELAKEAWEADSTVSAEITLEGAARGDASHESVYAVESAMITQDGNSVIWIVVRDVTERVQTEQIRRDFVANASHELRTPLTLINGYIENLLDGMLEEKEMAEKSLRVMDKHGKRIVRIVEDMLTISKLESTKDAVNREPFDFAECATDVIDNLAVPIEEKKASVVFLGDEENREMLGDRFYWDQILINLVENALKENAATGLQIEIGFRVEGESCVVWVADDGVGISAEQARYVFKRFYRGAKHHSKKVKGTGLGLSIVKRAVEAHGGTIELKSTPGVRTVFTIRVPRG